MTILHPMDAEELIPLCPICMTPLQIKRRWRNPGHVQEWYVCDVCEKRIDIHDLAGV